MFCKNCGVELEEQMIFCPLCGQDVNETIPVKTVYGQAVLPAHKPMSQPQKKFTWEIVSIILLSGAVTTTVVDYLVNKKIGWSEYTAAISLTIFCYVSLFAFWKQRTLIELAGGFLLSSVVMVLLDALSGGIDWSLKMAVPLLFIISILVMILIFIFRESSIKGINLLVYAFIAAAILCLAIDGIISFYRDSVLVLDWSLIVAACTFPVVLVLIFVHVRLKKGRSLEKTFHV